MWYVIHTKPRQEKLAAMNLRSEDISVYAPRIKRTKIIRNRFTKVSEPLFPCYIFANFDPCRQFNLVRYTRGVRSIVGSGQKIWPVSQNIIDIIQSRQDEHGYVSLDPELQPGDRIEIIAGHFQGYTGVLSSHLKPSERVIVLLQNITMQTKIELNHELLKRAN